jgi:hypothetical protein
LTFFHADCFDLDIAEAQLPAATWDTNTDTVSVKHTQSTAGRHNAWNEMCVLLAS